MATYLRVRTYVMAGRAKPTVRHARLSKPSRNEKPIAQPVLPDHLAATIAGLPADNRLASSGPLDVWVGESGQLGPVLTEIGRLR